MGGRNQMTKENFEAYTVEPKWQHKQVESSLRKSGKRIRLDKGHNPGRSGKWIG